MKNLITQLGATLGIPELALDDESYCCLFFDDLVLNMEWEAETGILFLYSHCGALPQNPSHGLLTQLLEANFFQRQTNGSTLGIDQESRTIVMCQRLTPQHMDYLQFEQTIETFVHTAQAWTAHIANFKDTHSSQNIPLHDMPTFA